MKRFSARLLSVLSLLFGIGLCVGLVLWQGLKGPDVFFLIEGFSFFWVFSVFFLTWALMICGERKWILLAKGFYGDRGREPYTGFFFRHYLWQNWIAQFVPPTLALTLGRGWAARRMEGVSVFSGIGNGLIDLATDFAFLCAILPGAFLVLFKNGGWVEFFYGAACGLAVLVLVGFGVRRFVKGSLRNIFWDVCFLSFARVFLVLLRLLAGVKAFSFGLALLPVVALTPVVALVSFIPLTPGNLGLAEWGWVGGLAYAGQSTRDAALYAIGFRLLVLVAQTLLLGLNEAYVRLGKKPFAL